MQRLLPSVLWHCRFGVRKSIWPVKLSDGYLLYTLCLQCFDTVGWAVRKSIRPVKIDWWGVGVVICQWGADCLHNSPADATATQTPSSLASFKSRLVLPFWCRLTHIVLEKRSLNGCISSSCCQNDQSLLCMYVRWMRTCIRKSTVRVTTSRAQMTRFQSRLELHESWKSVALWPVKALRQQTMSGLLSRNSIGECLITVQYYYYYYYYSLLPQIQAAQKHTNTNSYKRQYKSKNTELCTLSYFTCNRAAAAGLVHNVDVNVSINVCKVKVK